MMEISMTECKKRLGILWFTGAGILFFLLISQTAFGHYGDKSSEAWGWLMPSIMPTLSLIVGVLSSDTLGRSAKNKTVDKFIFTISFYLSFIYIMVMILTILIQPFASIHPLDLMKQSNIWMGPFQGLVSASIGIFFVKGK
jgi:Na+/H+-dicarboxylate symporter